MKRIALSLVLAAMLSCDEPEPVVLSGRAMGTTWQVSLPPGTDGREVAAIIERVEAEISNWRPESALSRFNRSRSTEPVLLPPEFADALRAALRVSQETEGALDITVAPLVRFWGFGPGSASGESLEAARRRVDYRKLVFDGAALRKTDPEVEVDLSCVGEGLAIDRIAAWLDGRGVPAYLIELGGELKAKGRPWRIGLERPEPGARRLRGVVELTEGAISTSGTYRQRVKGRPHVIDPRTGRPVEHGLVSVSVIHESAVRADAIATALLVLGPERGWAFAEERDLAATFVFETPEGLREHPTPRFPPMHQPLGIR